MRNWIPFLLLSLSFLPGLAQAEEAQSFVESIIAEYRTMVPEDGAALTDAQREANAAVRTSLLAHLDVDKLGKLALKDHWDNLTAEQQAEFLSVLHGLLDERAVQRIQATKDQFEVEYDGSEDLEEGEVKVLTILKARGEEYFIDFVLYPQEETWMIYDIITDDVSTVRNYRDQFNKIIKEDGFDELLRRMKDNLLDGDSEKKTDAP